MFKNLQQTCNYCRSFGTDTDIFCLCSFSRVSGKDQNTDNKSPMADGVIIKGNFLFSLFTGEFKYGNDKLNFDSVWGKKKLENFQGDPTWGHRLHLPPGRALNFFLVDVCHAGFIM